MRTRNIHSYDKMRKFPYIFVFMSYWKNFAETHKRVRISQGKRAIGVRVIEVRLYLRDNKVNPFVRINQDRYFL